MMNEYVVTYKQAHIKVEAHSVEEAAEQARRIWNRSGTHGFDVFLAEEYLLNLNYRFTDYFTG